MTETHGTRSTYTTGCRCLPCRSANSRYQAEPMVSAETAQKHLIALQRAGVGQRLITEVSQVSGPSIIAIREGVRGVIRASTERAILLVDRSIRGETTLVPAKPTWKLIGELMEEGFTEAEVAKKLGYKTLKVQLNRDRVTARTEQRVAQLYARIMGDGE